MLEQVREIWEESDFEGRGLLTGRRSPFSYTPFYEHQCFQYKTERGCEEKRALTGLVGTQRGILRLRDRDAHRLREQLPREHGHRVGRALGLPRGAEEQRLWGCASEIQ